MRISGSIGVILVLTAAGCMSWTPGWETSMDGVNGHPSATIAEADALFDQADDAASLARSISAYESAAAGADDRLHVQTRLAEANILYGAAYASGRREKAAYYERGLRHAERAMATNDGFRDRVEAGESIAEASAVLGRDEAEAMLLWVTGVSYYFREALTTPGRIASFRTISQTGPVLERLMSIDPELEHGAVPFSLAIHYIARPPWAGRDLDRAAELFDQAGAISPRSLLIPWGRAKYLHSRTGDHRAFVRDLEWVVEQDPRTAATPYPWNVYIQRDAREMLSSTR